MRRFINILILSCLSVFCLAQEEQYDDQNATETQQVENDVPAIAEADTLPTVVVGDYIEMLPKCARVDSNFVRFPAGVSGEMDRFVDKLDSVLLFGSGRVSILHIGGSHIQADMYTDVIRHRIDTLNNGLLPPRGLIFPYRVAKTNNPLNFSVRYGGEWDKARCSVYKPRPALGLSGISVFSSDTTAWISVNLNPDSLCQRWTANRLYVLCRTERQNLYPVLLQDSIAISPTSKEKHGYSFDLGEAVGEFTLSLRANSDTINDVFYLDGILPENDEQGIVYHTIGVNGASVPSYLGCEYFEDQLEVIKPDLVILGIGINDASGPNFNDSTFISNYDSLLRTIRRVSPECAFVFMTNNDSYMRKSRRRRVVNQNGPKVQRDFYHLAEKWRGGLWDLFEIMGGLNSMDAWTKAHLAQKDHVHFTRSGYNVVGNLFYDALLGFYLNYEANDEH